MYNPSDPIIEPNPGVGGEEDGEEKVTLRKFAQAKQSQEIISAMELIEVTFPSQHNFSICSFAGFRSQDNWKWEVIQERVKIFREVRSKNLGSKSN